MDCSDMKGLLAPFAAGTLSEEQAKEIETHLAGCPSCRKAVKLLRMDDAAVASVLIASGGASEKRSRRRSPLRIPLLLALVAGLTLLGLHFVYRSLETRNRRPGLDEPISMVAEDRPLDHLLREVSERTGVRVGRADMDRTPEPVVTLRLPRPVRLSSLLALLTDFYGVEILVREKPFTPSFRGSEEVAQRITKSRVTCNLVNQSLPDTLTYITLVKAVNIVIRPEALQAARAETVTIDVKKRPLSTVLTYLLDPRGFTWTVRHEVIVVEQR